MAEDLTCSVCGLPKELCLCEDVKREQTTVTLRTEKRTYGKLVTIVEGVSADMVKQVASELKKACATGGDVKNGAIELQGDNVRKLHKILPKKGFTVSQ